MSRNACFGNNRGFTLVELIISMVVVSIALGGVLMVMNYTVQRSADPMLQHQALAIAESYLEEVLLHSYHDPDDDPDADGETDRDLFDDVDDYNGLNNEGAHDQNGAAIDGLGNYTVSVGVAGETLEDVDGLLVTVTVTDPAGNNLSLRGFKADY
jgi:MSHA pilin protein MshD